MVTLFPVLLNFLIRRQHRYLQHECHETVLTVCHCHVLGEEDSFTSRKASFQNKGCHKAIECFRSYVRKHMTVACQHYNNSSVYCLVADYIKSALVNARIIFHHKRTKSYLKIWPICFLPESLNGLRRSSHTKIETSSRRYLEVYDTRVKAVQSPPHIQFSVSTAHKLSCNLPNQFSRSQEFVGFTIRRDSISCNHDVASIVRHRWEIWAR